MSQYLEYLKNPFIGGFAAGVAIIIFAYIDKRSNDRDFNNQYFIRLFCGVFIMVTGLLYLAGSDKKSHSSLRGGGGGGGGGGGSNMVSNGIGSSGMDIYADMPDF